MAKNKGKNNAQDKSSNMKGTTNMQDIGPSNKSKGGATSKGGSQGESKG